MSQQTKKPTRTSRSSAFQRALRKNQGLAKPKRPTGRQSTPRIAMWEWDITSDRVLVSPAGAALLDLEAMEAGVTAREVLALVHPRDRAKFLQFQLEVARRPGSYLASELRMKSAGGAWRALQLLARATAEESSDRSLRVVGSLVAVNDLPPQAAARAAPSPRQGVEPQRAVTAQASGDAVRKLLDACTDWSWELDAQYRITSSKHQGETTAGPQLGQHQGQPLWTLPLFEASKAEVKALESALRAHQVLDNFAITGKLPNTTLELRLHAVPRLDERGAFNGYIGVTRELRGGAQEQKPAAVRDALHMLANQQVLTARLEKEIARAQKSGHLFALLLVELDRINTINASHGPNVVNFVVVEAGQRILRCVRENDTLARIGRGEFLLLVSGLNKPSDATRVATSLTNSLAEPIAVGEHRINCGCNVGISVFPNDGNDAELLMKRARLAAMHAKEKGRNTYHFFSHELVQRTLEHMQIENDLHLALERKEFSLCYQPRINLNTGTITGAEALLRWNRGGKGLVRPDVFIGMAEKLGIIEPLGDWALAEACKQLKIWRKDLPDLRVAVNVSAMQLKNDKRFVQATLDALSKTGLKGSSLELELTEMTSVHEMHDLRGILRELSEMGIRIALDDFGTNYASLSHLKNMPIQILKMDRTFLSEIERSKKDARVVRAVVDMAHALDMTVVAEGVESDSQVAVLRELGCDEFQGNWFCPALPAHDLTSRMIIGSA